MSFNQNLLQRQETYQDQKQASYTNKNSTISDDRLSSSGIDSDWILFSPGSGGVQHDADEVLSESINEHDVEHDNVSYRNRNEIHNTSKNGNNENGNNNDDDDDDDDSLIDSFNTNPVLKLSLPTHDSGYFGNHENGASALTSSEYNNNEGDDNDNQHDNDEATNYYQSLRKNDGVMSRIEIWRKEQARLLIDDLTKDSDVSSSKRSLDADDLLASWGVDDNYLKRKSSTLSNTTLSTEKPVKSEEKYKVNPSKRFYGDTILENYTKWEVNRIKHVANGLSTSLVRDVLSNGSSQPFDKAHFQKTRRNSSILSNLSHNKNAFLNTATVNEPFWKKDLSSVQSSLSLSANSIMFGTLTIGDVI